MATSYQDSYFSLIAISIRTAAMAVIKAGKCTLGLSRIYGNGSQPINIPSFMETVGMSEPPPFQLFKQIPSPGKICTFPIPPREVDKNRMRAFARILEATFSWYFWTMDVTSLSLNYLMSLICPWELEDLEWRGLCSHTALTEGFHLDPIAVIEIRRTYTQAQYERAKRANETEEERKARCAKDRAAVARRREQMSEDQKERRRVMVKQAKRNRTARKRAEA